MGVLSFPLQSQPPLAEYVEVHVAEAHEPEPVVWTPEKGEAEAYKAADKYDLGSLGLREDFVKTIKCESRFAYPEIQSDHYKNGVRENSWGYAQFNLPSGLTTADDTTITYEIAVDPILSLDAAAYNFSIGNASHWTCFNGL